MSENNLYGELQKVVGATGSPQVARQPVNVSTIQNWCDAMSEANPRFTSGEVAPPAMLNVWTMPGLVMGRQPRRNGDDPTSSAYGMLDAAGFTGVVAVNSEQVYRRELVPGDLVTGTTRLVDISAEKSTALGVGHFVTTEVEYVDQNDEPVGSLFFRILKYRPGTGRQAETDGDTASPSGEKPPRPRPVWNQDQAWFWEGLRKRELRIQRFLDDGSLMHPPANSNPKSHTTDYEYEVASGRAELYSYTVVHYPKVPSFEYPHIVGLVELEEGTRLVTDIVGVTPEQLEIGMPLQVCFVDSHEDITLHAFRPADPEPRTTTLTASDVSVGDTLPLKTIPLDPRLVVSTALATRDFQDVHHDRDAAQAKGSKDIFMNILTSSGLSNVWLGEWAGPDARFERISIGLGAPNYPYDHMTMSGSVTEVGDDGTVSVGFTGRNSLGNHITGTATLVLPEGSAS